jgi:hypothetical protein
MHERANSPKDDSRLRDLYRKPENNGSNNLVLTQALRYRTKVKRGGRVESLKAPLKAGTRVGVIPVQPDQKFQELLKASETTFDFWNNPIDDETWNHHREEIGNLRPKE